MSRNLPSFSVVVIGMIIGIGIGQVGLSRAIPTSVTASPAEKECVVHPLPAEVVEQLLTAANASLSHLQDKKRSFEGHEGNEDPVSLSSLKG